MSCNGASQFHILYHLPALSSDDNAYNILNPQIKKMNAIEVFGREYLNGKEFELAKYLSRILKNPNCIFSGVLISEILPTYSEKRGKSSYTLDPDPIYRPLYYLHMYSDMKHFKENTRIFLINASAHLEGCLLWLTKNPPKFRGTSKKPFGNLVYELFKEGILSDELAKQLLRFNSLFNVPAKHRTAFFQPHSRLDKRTFSCFDASLAFLIMRKLSIELFKILTSKNVSLPHGWKEFDDNWFSPIWCSKNLKTTRTK